MFSQKNFSPVQLSVIVAAILAIPIGILIFILNNSVWFSFFVILIFGGVCYALIHFILQTFIYRKIKLIYKLIYQTKASKRETFYFKNILPQKKIEEVHTDVEEWAVQHKAEIELLQQNEIFRKEFLQNLSHELKTPIFAIQGYVETLLNGAIDNPAVNKKFLISTFRNIERLTNLINDVDEISTLESGKQILMPENFIVQDLLKEVYETLAINANKKEVKCIIKKGCEFPLSVYADKEKIRQVFINLIENAIKYGKQHGIIECSFYKVDEKKVLIEISDNGEGIAEDHLKRIFERFYRTDTARSRNVGGSGLGLAICKHIIEAHNQNIHVRSKIDVGSTFGFILPKRKD